MKDAINAKILKDIKFPMMLDTFELCTKELQDKLVPMRTKFKDHEDRIGKIALYIQALFYHFQPKNIEFLLKIIQNSIRKGIFQFGPKSNFKT